MLRQERGHKLENLEEGAFFMLSLKLTLTLSVHLLVIFKRNPNNQCHQHSLDHHHNHSITKTIIPEAPQSTVISTVGALSRPSNRDNHPIPSTYRSDCSNKAKWTKFNSGPNQTRLPQIRLDRGRPDRDRPDQTRP